MTGLPSSASVSFRKFQSGDWSDETADIISEKSVSLNLNGETWLSLLCTPVDLEALAIGFLYNEGFNSSRDEVETVEVCKTGEIVDVWLSHSVKKPETWQRTTGCTGGVTQFYGGKRRQVLYKEILEVLWQGGARRRALRLLVVAPTPYRKRKSSRLYYRNPAYLLTTDLKGHARVLLQIYFDRWQIEVNHREEKDTLGVGQAQLWNETSVPKQPVLAVAAYSALLLASLKAFGAERGETYAPLPKWRKSAKRPSCLDLVALLRKEVVEHPELTAELKFHPTYKLQTSAAAA